MTAADIVISAILFGFSAMLATVGIVTAPNLSRKKRVTGFIVCLFLCVGGWSIVYVRLLRTSSPSSPPRLVITQTDLKFIAPNDNMRVNVYYGNQGNSIVSDVAPGLGIYIVGAPMQSAEEDKYFAQVLSGFSIDKNNSSEILPGSNLLVTLPFYYDQKTPITHDGFEYIQKHQLTMYVMLSFVYKNVADNSVWVTEQCQFWDYRTIPGAPGPVPPILCNGHNGIFRVTKKGVEYARP